MKYVMSDGFSQAMHDWFDVTLAHQWAADECGDCESPIEQMFLVAFLLASEAYHRHYIIESQATIRLQDGTEFRADFNIYYKDKGCFVECDGRDFHHASWAQIERDRQRDSRIEAETGDKVFRFPGTQIHSDPIECVWEVFTYLDAIARGDIAA